MRTSVIVVALLLVPRPSLAQSFELTGGIDVPLKQPSFTYDTRYVPRVVFFESSGEAGQTLTLRRERRPAFWGAFAWFPGRHAGLEARAGWRTANLVGTSGPHRVSLTYTSRQPPDYVPRQFTLQRSDDQPGPEGRLETLSVDLVAVGRFGDPRRVRVSVSGGLAMFAIHGDVQPVRLSVFRLGGHSTLFSDEHAVTLAFNRKWGFGAVGGLDAHRALSDRVGVIAGLRVLAPRTAAAPMQVTAVSGGVFPLTVAEAQDMLAPAPFRVRPWTVDVVVGLRVIIQE